MDLNIGTAFWFAARGQGYLRDYTQHEIEALLHTHGCSRDAADGSMAKSFPSPADEYEGVCEDGSTNITNQIDAAIGSAAGMGTGTAAGTRNEGMQKKVSGRRPLLRMGGVGAAAGVGADTARAKARRQHKSAILTRAAATAAPSPSGSTGEGGPISAAGAGGTGGGGAAGGGGGMISPPCGQTDCTRVCKLGCERGMCKKCCDRVHREGLLQLVHQQVEQTPGFDNAQGVENGEEGIQVPPSITTLEAVKEVVHELLRGGGKSGVNGGRKEGPISLGNTCAVHRVKERSIDGLVATLTAQYCRNYGLHVGPAKLAVDLTRASAQYVAGGGARAQSAWNEADSASTETITSQLDGASTSPSTSAAPAQQRSLSVAAGATAAVATAATSPVVRTPYVCSCRALLVGIGADEQMAGYGRHRTAFERADPPVLPPSPSPPQQQASLHCADTLASEFDAKLGSNSMKDPQTAPVAESTSTLKKQSPGIADEFRWEALRNEMNRDLDRLWKRNLGR